MVIIFHYRCITVLYLLGCILFNDAVTNTDYTASTDLILMYNEKETIRKQDSVRGLM